MVNMGNRKRSIFSFSIFPRFIVIKIVVETPATKSPRVQASINDIQMADPLQTQNTNGFQMVIIFMCVMIR